MFSNLIFYLTTLITPETLGLMLAGYVIFSLIIRATNYTVFKVRSWIYGYDHRYEKKLKDKLGELGDLSLADELLCEIPEIAWRQRISIERDAEIERAYW